MSALYTTLIIALLSALIATVIGTAAAIGIQSHAPEVPYLHAGRHQHSDAERGYRDRRISLMLLFIAFRYVAWDSPTILLAHITFNIPYVILSVMPKLKQTNRRHLRGGPGPGGLPGLRLLQGGIPGYPSRRIFPVSCWPLPCRWMTL